VFRALQKQGIQPCLGDARVDSLVFLGNFQTYLRRWIFIILCAPACG